MLFDFSDVLYGPLHAILGSDATIVTEAGDTIELTAIDRTAPFETPDQPGVLTIRPVAAVRAVDLADNDVTASDLVDAELTLSGKTWRVLSTEARATPNGESDGEVWLFLSEVVE